MVASIKLKQCFGAEIRKARLKAKMTQIELAGCSGLAPSYIRALEAGQYSPSLDAIFNLALALDVDPDSLIMPFWPMWKKLPENK